MAAVRSRRRLAIGLLLSLGFAALLWLALAAPPVHSPRVQTVERLIAAAKAGDRAAFLKLAPGDVPYWPLSDVMMTLTPEELKRFTDHCRVRQFAEGADTVAVDFGCEGSTRRVIVDFTFCGDRISMVEYVEWGRWVLSPLLGDWVARALGQKKATCPAPR